MTREDKIQFIKEVLAGRKPKFGLPKFDIWLYDENTNTFHQYGTNIAHSVAEHTAWRKENKVSVHVIPKTG